MRREGQPLDVPPKIEAGSLLVDSSLILARRCANRADSGSAYSLKAISSFSLSGQPKRTCIGSCWVSFRSD